MTTKTNIKGAIALAVVLTLTVIGRYAGYGAEFLRPEVLVGFGVVATLIALITLEYRTGSPRVVTQPVARLADEEIAAQEAKIVPLTRNDERLAA